MFYYSSVRINKIISKDSGRSYFMRQCEHKSANSQYCRPYTEGKLEGEVKGQKRHWSLGLYINTQQRT